jgi:hypothetical protein
MKYAVKRLVLFFLFTGSFHLHAQVKVDDFYVISDGRDWSQAIQRSHTSMVQSTVRMNLQVQNETDVQSMPMIRFQLLTIFVCPNVCFLFAPFFV